MLIFVLLTLWLQAGNIAAYEAAAGQEPAPRCADIFESAEERVRPSLKIAPGAPPLLSFRHVEGKRHQRFSGIDLTWDDAGH